MISEFGYQFTSSILNVENPINEQKCISDVTGIGACCHSWGTIYAYYHYFFTESHKMNKMHCFRERLLIVCSLSCTCFGLSWVLFKDLQIITERSGLLIYAMWYHYTLLFVIT